MQPFVRQVEVLTAKCQQQRVGQLSGPVFRKCGDIVWFLRESAAKYIGVAEFAREAYFEVLGSVRKQEVKHVLMTKVAEL
jgi:hypothetical protein